MILIAIFFWVSYTLICLAACLVVYDFMERHITLRRRKSASVKKLEDS